ncbi:MAG: hypothetical protein ACK559_29345, partial [bacterium]
HGRGRHSRHPRGPADRPAAGCQCRPRTSPVRGTDPDRRPRCGLQGGDRSLGPSAVELNLVARRWAKRDGLKVHHNGHNGVTTNTTGPEPCRGRCLVPSIFYRGERRIDPGLRCGSGRSRPAWTTGSVRASSQDPLCSLWTALCPL